MKVAITIILSLWANTLIATEPGIVIGNAWINEAPPTVNVHAGYFVAENRGPDTIELIQITSPDYRAVEMHRSIIVDGTAKMEIQQTVSIEPGQTLTFQPGGYHLMLFNPARALKQGDSVELVFSFSDDTTLTATAEIKRGDMEHHHH